jgi:hypothetical protein
VGIARLQHHAALRGAFRIAARLLSASRGAGRFGRQCQRDLRRPDLRCDYRSHATKRGALQRFSALSHDLAAAHRRSGAETAITAERDGYTQATKRGALQRY